MGHLSSLSTKWSSRKRLSPHLNRNEKQKGTKSLKTIKYTISNLFSIYIIWKILDILCLNKRNLPWISYKDCWQVDRLLLRLVAKLTAVHCYYHSLSLSSDHFLDFHHLLLLLKTLFSPKSNSLMYKKEKMWHFINCYYYKY